MRTDILLTEFDNYFDLTIADGDIAVGESDTQHIKHNLLAYQGNYKQYPTLGCGILNYLNSSFDEEISRLVALNLELDGYKGFNYDFDSNNLIISRNNETKG